MSQIKELNFTEKTVTTLAVIGGLLLFGFSLTKCQDTLGLDSNKIAEVDLGNINEVENDDELGAYLDEAEQNIDILQSDLADSNKLNEELSDKVIGLTEENGTLYSKLKNSSSNFVAPAAVAAVAAPLIGKDELKSLKKTLKNKEEEIEGLENEVVALEGTIKGKEANIDELERKIQGLNTERDALTRTSEEKANNLRSELDKIKTGEGDASIAYKSQIAEIENEWKKKLDDLKVKNEMEKAKYTNSLKSELSNLRVALRKEKTKKVFANSSDDLAPSAQKLIAELSGFEKAEDVANASGETPSEEVIASKEKDLDELYKGIDKNIRSRRKAVVNFDSGSSAVKGEYQNKITELLKTAKPDSYFIAVGYADVTGSANANKSLSSKRATKVAEVMKPSLKDTQFVQAFYLGQTERFGAPDNNRVVEIWEITE